MATPGKYAMQNEGRIALAVVRKVAVVLLVLGLAACNPDKFFKMFGGGGGGAPTCSNPGAQSDTAQLRSCINDLTFNPLTAVGDEQRLLVRDTVGGGGVACHGDPNHTCRYGPLAKIEPVID